MIWRCRFYKRNPRTGLASRFHTCEADDPEALIPVIKAKMESKGHVYCCSVFIKRVENVVFC